MISTLARSTTIQRWLLGLLALSLFFIRPVPTQAAGTTYYVAPNGLNTNPGTLSQPFQTIAHAASLAQPGDKVIIRAGHYHEAIRPARSGTASAPIVYESYPGETVSVRGTTRVAATGWTAVAGSTTWFTSWPGTYSSSNNQSDQVFANDQMLLLARWPEETNRDLSRPVEATIDRIISSTPTGQTAWLGGYTIKRVVFEDAAFTETNSQLWKGAQIWMGSGNYSSSDGNGITGKVIATDGATHRLTVEVTADGASGDTDPGNYQLGKGSRYYLFNPQSLEGLRFDGHWWRDPATNRLYVRLPGGASPRDQRIEVKQRDYAFDLTDRSYITLRNLEVFGASITTDTAAGTGIRNGSANRKEGTTAPAHHLLLDGLTLRYVSHFTDLGGDLQGQWSYSSGVILSGSDNVLQNSEIAWSAGNGLVVLGQRNLVKNNRIHDTNYMATDGGAIGTGRTTGAVSVDTEIAYNTVYNTGVDGIDFTGLINSTNSKSDIRARIHHNVVYNTVLQTADSGAIKAFASDGNWARIDHNIIYNTGGSDVSGKYVFYGIYLDYPRVNGRYIVDHNVVYNTPTSLNINAMKNTEILNNTFIARPEVARSPINNSASTGTSALPGVVIRNTLSNRAFRGISGTAAVDEKNIITATETTAWFIDPTTDVAKRNYQLASSATAAINTGLDVAPFNDALPADIGAYEHGQPRWTAGATSVTDPVESTGGLQGVYYPNVTLTEPSGFTRTDAQVQFDWGTGSPGSPLGNDGFSVRWTGEVEAPVSGAYTFATTSDDGVRLWVNNALVIDNWTDHAPTANQSAAISLTAGQRYALRLEYYERGGGAVIRLNWSYPGQALQAIPQTALYPAAAATTPVVTRIHVYPRSNFAARMVGGTFQGSTTSSTSGFVDLATISTQPSGTAWTELTVSTTTRYRYLRYRAPAGSYGNVAEIAFYAGTQQLTGTVFGTDGSYAGSGNTRDKAFDGSTSTFFDAPSADGAVLGIDLGP